LGLDVGNNLAGEVVAAEVVRVCGWLDRLERREVVIDLGDCAGLRVYKVMVNVDGGDGLCGLDHIKLRIGLAD